MKKKLFYIIIAIGVCIGIALRIISLDTFPVGLHIDEAQVGYNAYSILHTGKDEFGNAFPHHLNIFGFSRPTQIMYLTSLFIPVFGLDEFSTRFPTAVVGVLTFGFLYLLCRELFKNKPVALIAVAIFALSPWHILFSRATSEAIFELFWVVGAMYFLLKGIRTHQVRYVIAFYGASFLAFFSYLPSRVILPALILCVVFLFFKEIRTSRRFMTILGSVIAVYLVFPTFVFLQDSSGLARFKQVSIFTSPTTQLVLEEQIREDGSDQHPVMTRFFHNKAKSYIYTFLDNYGQYFTVSYLGLQGGYPMRYEIPNVGILHLIEVPFLLIGLYLLIRRRDLKGIFVVLWFFVAPISASLTYEDSPNMQRALLGVIPAVIIISVGVKGVYDFLRTTTLKSAFIGVLLMAYGISLLFFVHEYFVHQVAHRPWDRMADMKEYVQYVTSESKNYKKVVMTKHGTEPYIYLLFYNQVGPSEYHKISESMNAKGDWTWGKFTFIHSDCVDFRRVIPERGVLYADRFTCKEDKRKTYIHDVNRPDGSLGVRFFIIQDPQSFKSKKIAL